MASVLDGAHHGNYLDNLMRIELLSIIKLKNNIVITL